MRIDLNSQKRTFLLFCPPDWLHSHDVQGVYFPQCKLAWLNLWYFSSFYVSKHRNQNIYLRVILSMRWVRFGATLFFMHVRLDTTHNLVHDFHWYSSPSLPAISCTNLRSQNAKNLSFPTTYQSDWYPNLALKGSVCHTPTLLSLHRSNIRGPRRILHIVLRFGTALFTFWKLSSSSVCASRSLFRFSFATISLALRHLWSSQPNKFCPNVFFPSILCKHCAFVEMFSHLEI